MSEVVTKFAPSPTSISVGLHVGGLRTALYNYCMAKHERGKFLLRIEDTDLDRSTNDSYKSIVKDLLWAGILWDEGPSYNADDLKNNQIGSNGPYFQSQRSKIYDFFLEKLLKKNMAYEKDKAFFFKTSKEDIVVCDRILGEIRFPSSQYQDFIIKKSDGTPTFHFAVVIDDACMNVSHVIRGQEHLQNCWKHMSLQTALDIPTPEYAHIPLIMNQDGSKMSKRQNNEQINIVDFVKEGYIPSALLNYLALLGWNPGKNIEHFDLDFICQNICFDNMGSSNAKFDYKKLSAFNLTYLNKLSLNDFKKTLYEYGTLFYTDMLEKLKNKLMFDGFAEMHYARNRILKDAYETCRFLISDNLIFNASMMQTIIDKYSYDIVNELYSSLLNLNAWHIEEIHNIFILTSMKMNISLGKLSQIIRLAVTGGTVSPPIANILFTLGKDISLEKIFKFLNECSLA